MQTQTCAPCDVAALFAAKVLDVFENPKKHCTVLTHDEEHGGVFANFIFPYGGPVDALLKTYHETRYGRDLYVPVGGPAKAVAAFEAIQALGGWLKSYGRAIRDPANMTEWVIFVPYANKWW